MKDNKLHYSLALCLLVLISLLLLSVVPTFSVGAWKFRKIDLLSDIRLDAPDTLLALTLANDSIENDSVQAVMDSAVHVIQAGCKPGITCIEDYSADGTALKAFLSAMANREYERHPVRIALYGDSFIEGDVFCGSMRDTLQSLFGGQGVGYMPITSEVAGFRTTIKHSFENWYTRSLISKKDSSFKEPMGPAGFCFIPRADNWVEYRPSYQRFLREFSTIKLYYKNLGHASLSYTLNDDTIHHDLELPVSDRLKEWTLRESKVKAVRFSFDADDSLCVYGASFEDTQGIYVDNFSLRGNSGIVLHNVPDRLYQDFHAYRKYKLVVLQYGLNVVREDSLTYSWYASSMIKVVNKIKKDFPDASILLVGVSDRSTNTSGTFKTMAAIPAMRNAQRYIARKTGIAFWDLYEAMGGENSMVKFAEAKPALAAKDYTHLTFKGGKKLSGLLVKSLLFEKEKYERKGKL